MTSEWVASAERLAELEPAWDALTGTREPPFLRFWWFVAWWRAFGGEDELRVCALWDGQELAGCFPCRRERGGLAALANYHSPLFVPPARDGHTLAALARETLAGSPALVAPGVPADHPAAAVLHDAADHSIAEPWQTALLVETGGSFDDYRRRTRPSWLKRIARYRRQLGRRHDLELTVAAPPRDLDEELAEGFRVEASGWKGQRGTAILSSPATESFYRQVASALRDSGELRLSRLALDGRLVAFDLAFIHGGRLYSLKTGYDEAFAKSVPGLVLRLSIVEHCFAALDIEAHELLGEAAEWKRSFATASREQLRLRCYQRGPITTGRYLSRRALIPPLRRGWRLARRVAGKQRG